MSTSIADLRFRDVTGPREERAYERAIGGSGNAPKDLECRRACSNGSDMSACTDHSILDAIVAGSNRTRWPTHGDTHAFHAARHQGILAETNAGTTSI